MGFSHLFCRIFVEMFFDYKRNDEVQEVVEQRKTSSFFTDRVSMCVQPCSCFSPSFFLPLVFFF